MGTRATVILVLLAVVIGCAEPEIALSPPYSLTQLTYFEDGGSTGITVQGVRGNEVRFCFDFGLRTRTPGRIYFGDTWHARGRLVAAGGRLETQIKEMLRSWLDANYSKARQQELLACQSLADAGEDEWAWRVLSALEQREDDTEASQ